MRASTASASAASDAGVAALLAEASCRGAAYNVRINAVAMPNKEAGAPLVAEALRLVTTAGEYARRATLAVEAQLG